MECDLYGLMKASTRVLVSMLIAASACGAVPERDSVQQVGGEVSLRNSPTPVATTDPMVRRADSLVANGRPWRATVLLAPRLVGASVKTSTPELRLTAARAAAGWEGWSEVERLLRDAPWLDAQFGGEGRELLVRAALERATDAQSDARLALSAARDEPTRVTRHVLLARVYDRANVRDSASAHYLAAAARLPRVADWLRLRAAGVTEDSAARSALFARLASATARARIDATDAQARERVGDYAGAARAFRRAGAPTSAFRVDALAARDSAARLALAHTIAQYLASSPSATDTRQTLDVLDKLGMLSLSDELAAARAAASAGTGARAVAGFERARRIASSPLSSADLMLYAGALGRSGRWSDAARTYATITSDALVLPLAAYQRARALLQAGEGGSARAALRDVATRSAGQRAAAAPALLLLADLQVDDGSIDGASQSLRELITRHPTATQAPLARFRLGLIQYAAAAADAAVTFDSVATLHPTDDEALAARYWAGRAYARSGRTPIAEERWKRVIQLAPLSYYAALSADRLHTKRWGAPAGPDSAAHMPAIDSAVARIVALQRLGMDVEARFEIDAMADRVERAPAEAAAIAHGLLRVGEPARAMRIAHGAIGRRDSSRAIFRAEFPIVHQDALEEEAQRNGLDPALVAGLIRQESSWNPRAASAASARGLMQLLPSVGASIAAGRRYPLWNPALLFEPDVSLELGSAHLASSLTRGVPTARALAAYNAGASRVARWSGRPGADDPELFTEWIPFTETRDYVRIVQRNAEVYRALYGLK